MSTSRRAGMRELLGSAICVAVILASLIAVDGRLRARVETTLGHTPRSAFVSWTDQATTVAGALFDAARDQSLEHAPMLVFSAVGIVLVLFMLKV